MIKLINIFRICPVRHWSFRYLCNRFKLFLYEINHPDYPWLTQQANEFLQSCLRKTDIGLEWGSGRSTIWFAMRVANLTSVEGNLAWCEKVKTRLVIRGLRNVQLCYCEIPQKFDKAQSNRYVAIADSFPDNSLDFALIDGNYRCECAIAVLKRIKPGGLLIIDNINVFLPSNSHSPDSRIARAGPSSEKWALLVDLLWSWRCIWTSNGVSDTAIWVKPYNDQGSVSDKPGFVTKKKCYPRSNTRLLKLD